MLTTVIFLFNFAAHVHRSNISSRLIADRLCINVIVFFNLRKIRIPIWMFVGTVEFLSRSRIQRIACAIRAIYIGSMFAKYYIRRSSVFSYKYFPRS